MARDPRDESLRRHKEWLGFLQPVGLVVSPPALVDADCHVNADVAAEYQRFAAATSQKLLSGSAEPVSVVHDVRKALTDVFGWQAADLVAAADPRAADLSVALPEYGETLRPTYAVTDGPESSAPQWLMLIQELAMGQALDAVAEADDRKWRATAQARFERLLRETQVPIGLLSNGVELRLVYAPRGESPGHVTFPVPRMLEVSGRPMFAALFMLLREFRVFGAPDGQRLGDVLAASRKYQTTVSTELAKQVLAALYELLRGIQAADAQKNGLLLGEVLAKDPDQVYAGQLTVLLRLVFLLYAEDRGLMSASEVYVRHYSVTGLFEKLRADAGRHPDTMDQRYGAWARLLTLFRMVYDGARAGTLRIPARRGYLFDPNRYPFLEGRAGGSLRQPGERISPPLVSDGVIFRVLSNLMILDGERLSYRALDVEQIGSVYEAMMGFRVEVATGRSIAIKPKKPHGAPVTIDLDKLLAQSGDKRNKWFQEMADLKPTPKEAAALKAATTAEDAVAALDRKVAKQVTPNIVPPRSMVLQPSDERRRSGSHYTPRSLTEPIMRKALEPIIQQLGESPTPQQLLDLKVCDPAMGSGAFLVETARQLGELLVKAWHTHACLPKIPPDEDELLHAQRLVAQRCLYGVDKNPMAVDLAKLSLWLTTLAKDHPFTFVDHALRCGDSLVGLTREQIVEFHWNDCPQRVIGQDVIEERVKAATESRRAILDADEFTAESLKEQKLKLADEALNLVRFAGNLVVAAFYAADKDKQRHQKRNEYLATLSAYLQLGKMELRPTKEEAALRDGDKPIHPFHWEIEFPEVFDRSNPGFDACVGNPPFLRGKSISTNFGSGYTDWLLKTFEGANGSADLSAFFFRRVYQQLRSGGTQGLIATNSIAQGDTRSAGLRWICVNAGTIYHATRRLKWPGQAAVVVSLVHIRKGTLPGPYILNGEQAPIITAYLFHAGDHENPRRLFANEGKSHYGTVVSGVAGFTFDDSEPDATPIAIMEELLAKDPRNTGRIKPYIGGDEVNNSPTQTHHRYIMDFGTLTEEEARRWPGLFEIVERKVRPARTSATRDAYRLRWWQYAERQAALYEAIRDFEKTIVINCGASPYMAFAFVSARQVFANSLTVIAYDSFAAFCVLQSRVHEVWARFFSSSMKDDLRYTPTFSFETFPFASDFEKSSLLAAQGKAYCEFRADLMTRNNEGLTKTYNRFHDPNESSTDIRKLRELHDAMDRAVLAAYGPPFSELAVPPCEFLLDYEEEDDDEEETGKRQKKKPWRYRWPDAFRDEVLALLLELNKQRAEEEKEAAEKAGPGGNKKKGNSRKGKRLAGGSPQTDLFSQ